MHWRTGVNLAARRALVGLPDGRIGRLVAWPVPPAERTVSDGRSRGRRDSLATVIVDGRREHVDPRWVRLVPTEGQA